MGMFDYVRYSAPCFKCGAIIEDWQTKDAGCELSVVMPEQIGFGVFYCDCDQCGAWNQYAVAPSGPVVITPDHRRGT
jgi:hypothetical protein